MGRAVCVLAAIFLSGCAVSDVVRTNARLKEENDRLLLEQRRLRAQLDQLRQELAEEKRTVAQLRQELALERRKAQEGRPVPATAPGKTKKPPALSTAPLRGLKNVEIVQEGEKIRLILSNALFFKPGSAEISQKGQALLKRIAVVLKSSYPSATIRVDGHTDNTPVKKMKAKYPSNWELSTARASAVVRYLVRSGVNPRRIFAAGFGPYRPLASNATPQGRSRNRRVEIVIMP